MIKRIFPFLDWFTGYSMAMLRADGISGLTVALVLIPQSMAYAQLAGLPPYYGLYASFLPPMIASLFGSSRQLATGPVAVVSLMTSASLEPLATAGSEGYIAYAILLALMVGLFQLSLGVLRLGLVVNFLSHPVVNGFTNAAAIITAMLSTRLASMKGVTLKPPSGEIAIEIQTRPFFLENLIWICLKAIFNAQEKAWNLNLTVENRESHAAICFQLEDGSKTSAICRDILEESRPILDLLQAELQENTENHRIYLMLPKKMDAVGLCELID